jgi:formate hydrogenlyase subunit 3/multisubunit Na+/H+ antiporter MnhD subunit
MFVAFEALLLSAIYILLLTSKSERARDAALEMLIWTLVGSAGLLTGLGLLGGAYSPSTAPARWGLAAAICFLLGFGVKVPLWPATSWLLKAHVEASVEFSILLSGFIVKVGVLGLHRTLAMADEPGAGLFAAGLALIGLFDAASRLPAQRDLKRVVALTTVVEMNWAVFALGLGGAQQVAVAGYLCAAHCCTTATEFFLVEALTKRFGTRDLAYIGGVALAAPQLWLFSVVALLVTIGFPGTSIFWAKYVFFTGLVPALPGVAAALGVLFLVVLPIFFVRLWSLVWFGARAQAALVYDLSAREAMLLGLSLGASVGLGLAPGLLFWAFTPAAIFG